MDSTCKSSTSLKRKSSENGGDSDIRRPMNIGDLIIISSDHDRFLNFLKDKGLISKLMICPKCNEEMKFRQEGKTLGRWSCSKNTKHPDKKQVKISGSKGSYFENMIISPQKALLLSYCLVYQFTYDAAIRESTFPKEWGVCSPEDVVTAYETVSDWYSYGHEVMAAGLARGEMLGGKNVLVEIEESQFSKMRFRRKQSLEGLGVINMAEFLGPNRKAKVKMVEIPDNKKSIENLLKVLEEHVLPGTIIFNHNLSSFDSLNEKGYFRLKVDPFIELEVVNEIRSKIKVSQWQAAKKFLNSGKEVENFDVNGSLIEYMWRKNKGSDLFLAFLEDVKKLYPIQ